MKYNLPVKVIIIRNNVLGDIAKEETLLELGLAASVVVLLGGLGVLLFGRAAGGADRMRREHEAPPAPGSVPDERHQHTASVSAR